MRQNRLFEKQANDDFVKSLELTPEKIKQDLEKMKAIQGFPKAEEEDIVELSNPPYYTAYPNPYVTQFIAKFGSKYNPDNDNYQREPFVGDISEGKNHPIYMAHTYHAKVPHKAVMNYIEHYTKKNDLVFDGFCGTGMTGVACQLLERRAILNDLSPAATFIAANFNQNVDKSDLEEAILQITSILRREFHDYYVTKHTNGKLGEINYVIYSDVFLCPFCQKDIIFWEIALDEAWNFKENKNCSHCGADLKKGNLTRKRVDDTVVQVPVWISYIYENKRYFKKPDQSDLDLIAKIEKISVPYWYPNNSVMQGHNTNQPIKSHSIKRISDFYFQRTLIIMARLWSLINESKNEAIKTKLRFIFTSFSVKYASKLHNVGIKEGKINLAGQIPNTLCISSIIAERNIVTLLESKYVDILKIQNGQSASNIVTTQSSTNLAQFPSECIDYIFVDPPFGDNLMYSELNLIWESWLKVFTNNVTEAIINQFQQKDLGDYKNLMIASFQEFFRILKPNRWITVEFHNSKASVWKAIQESIIKAGFIVAQVAVLDKQQSTFKQSTSSGSVKNDLVINAYKPSRQFSLNFLKKSGLNQEKDFIKMHLDRLPVEPNIERSRQMLYSKLLAQYIQNSFEVRMDASEFYGLLRNNFVERDGFWFNPEQLPEYEKRLKLRKSVGSFNLSQTILGIDSEKTSIIWLSQFLRSPRSYSEISIEYNKNLLTSDDKIPELRLILEENFVTEAGKYRLPSIVEKREKEDFREKRLNREFQEVLQEANSGKKIVDVRKEALLHGLIQLYNKKAVDQIKVLGKRIDRKILESDDEIYAIIDWAMSKDD